MERVFLKCIHMKKRCEWVKLDNEAYDRYHDEEW